MKNKAQSHLYILHGSNEDVQIQSRPKGECDIYVQKHKHSWLFPVKAAPHPSQSQPQSPLGLESTSL